MLEMTDWSGTYDMHLTVPDAVNFSVSTGDNRLRITLREDKQLLSCIEIVAFIVRKQTGIS